MGLVSPDEPTFSAFRAGDVFATWRALLAPRRLVPILVVTVPIILVQGELAASVWGWPFIIGLVTAFLLIAPVAYRHLLADGLPAASAGWRLAVYAGLGLLAPLSLVWLPPIIGLPVFVSTAPTTFISAGLFWVAGYGLGRDIDLEARWIETSRRARALAAQAEQAQLMALKAHLDPHVLFNTLNAIAEWCRQDPEVAEQALVDLSALLRQLLVGVRAEVWPLAREMEAMRRYFDLFRIRDPSRFSVEWRGQPPAVTIPPMLLLPLAENAMTHGPGRGHRGPVVVDVMRDDHAVCVTLTNPGRFKGRRAGGQGLATVERRLALTYGGAGRVEVKARDDSTETRVVWPASPAEEEG